MTLLPGLRRLTLRGRDVCVTHDGGRRGGRRRGRLHGDRSGRGRRSFGTLRAGGSLGALMTRFLTRLVTAFRTVFLPALMTAFVTALLSGFLPAVLARFLTSFVTGFWTSSDGRGRGGWGRSGRSRLGGLGGGSCLLRGRRSLTRFFAPDRLGRARGHRLIAALGRRLNGRLRGGATRLFPFLAAAHGPGLALGARRGSRRRRGGRGCCRLGLELIFIVTLHGAPTHDGRSDPFLDDVLLLILVE